jgi:hypothetical protein
MEGNVTLRKFAVAMELLALSACDPRDSSTYTLYRDSATDGALMRIHVATFDADEDADYNRGNCEIARGLFQDQPGILVRYWCEVGRFRK